MERFFALSKEKQDRILEAGYQCFGKMGYKKASAQDIASAAGISKGMVFHYFGSKRGMYAFLIQRSFEEIRSAFQHGFDPGVTDFFDRILMMTTCKIDCLKMHPSLLTFFGSLYLETAEEVMDLTEQITAKAESFQGNALLQDMSTEKFKDPAYAELVWKLLIRYGEGCARSAMDVDALGQWMDEFTACIQMLRKNLYKEEYLKEMGGTNYGSTCIRG